METSTSREEFIENVKSELERLLEQEEEEIYSVSISREKLISYAKHVCGEIDNFKDDIWTLAEIVGSILYQKLGGGSLESGLIAFFVFRLFRKGINSTCSELLK